MESTLTDTLPISTSSLMFFTFTVVVVLYNIFQYVLQSNKKISEDTGMDVSLKARATLGNSFVHGRIIRLDLFERSNLALAVTYKGK